MWGAEVTWGSVVMCGCSGDVGNCVRSESKNAQELRAKMRTS